MKHLLNRRDFTRMLPSAAFVGLAGRESFASTAVQACPLSGTSRTFPEGFLWGTATSAYQVEGAAHEDGRGPSIWDTFSHLPGKTVNGATGDVADNDYHLYKDDVKMMHSLGVRAYRFSVSWPRVFPAGDGRPNPKGLDFYYRLVDDLLAHDIQPFCTLYHWDLPQALQDRGGWQSRSTPEAFGHYAGYVARHLSDRVHHFMTINEISSFIEAGYALGRHAPGLRLPPDKLYQARYYAVLAHGLGVQAIRSNSLPGTKVGVAASAAACVPVIETQEHIAAATKAYRELNAGYLTLMMEGQYTEAYLQQAGKNAPVCLPGEMQIIASRLDFVGLNVYQPVFIRAADAPVGYAIVPPPPSFPHMLSPWLDVGPEAIYWSPKLAAGLWQIPSIYITENGASCFDVLNADGKVYDIDRIMFLRNYLTQLHRCVVEGVPVHGYFLWSLLDNFEWADGFSRRFGLFFVDFATQKRIPKLSASFYREIIDRNGLA